MMATADDEGCSVQSMASVVEGSTRDLESVERRADRLAQTTAGLRALGHAVPVGGGSG